MSLPAALQSYRREAALPLLLALAPLLAGCGNGGSAAAAAPALAARATPAEWEALDDAVPPRRLRDPRTGITFIRVPAGEFRQVAADLSRTIRVSKPFLLAETELTVAQWRRYIDDLGGDRELPVPADDALPMPLSWRDSERFCARLGYRLPTEAEWELACRADHGDAGPWSTPAGLRDHAWFNANAGTGPQPVRGRSPNGFGFYDMIGNVWEWCSDWYGRFPFGTDPAPVDPIGPASGDGHALRGASWFTPGSPSPTYRTQDFVDTRNTFYGLRPAHDL
ncbi:MAG: formylglycine-generating enzyme family protein [Planctomycetes bacterium]|nr:formylglycine-generating enzyme family protein [Planctomycetota bacterium]